ncbi:MAG: hypothetical protein K1X91_05320 [Bacteriodetes bacterium]|nr:hypothetical protein [Bacteroidota bacterium]
MLWYLYIFIPVGLVVLIALVVLLRTRLEFAKQISDTGISLFTEFVAWLKRITFYDLKSALKYGVKSLKSNTTSKNYKYDRPWYLMVGADDSGKTSLIRNELNIDESQDNHHVNWGIFENGVILDINSRYFAPPNMSDGIQVFKNRSWKKLVKLINGVREKRPLDGVIVTIPITTIVNNVKNIAQIEETTINIKNKLTLLSKRVGMKLPIYVVFSKCDIIPNYSEFHKHQVALYRDDILGWNSPYSPEIGYEKHWLEIAFSEMLSNITRVQTYLLRTTDNDSQKDSIYDFYNTFNGLQEGINVIFSILFNGKVQTNIQIFRGMYFVGHDEVEENVIVQPTQIPQYVSPFDLQTQSITANTSVSKQNILFSGVLQKKIFPEFSIAQPLKNHLISKSRLSIILHTFTFLLLITGCLSIGLSWKELFRKREVLKQKAEEIRDERQTSKYQVEKSRKPFFYADQTKKYIAYFAELEHNKLYNTAIPASWFGYLHQDFRKCIALSLKDVVITGMKEEFWRRASELTDEQRKYTPKDTISLNRYSINSTPEYLALQNFVFATTEFEHHVKLFNTLSAPHSDQRLSKIIYYLYGKNIESDVLQMIESDYQLMKSVDKLDNVRTDDLATSFYDKGLTLRNDLLTKFSHSNPIVSSVNNFTLAYNSALHSVDDKEVYDSFFSMAQNLENLNSALKSKETSWINTEQFTLDVTGRKFIESIASSKLLGQDLKIAIERGFDTTFTQMRNELQSLSVPMQNGNSDTTLVLIINPESKSFTLSNNLVNTLIALNEWKKQSFASKVGKGQKLNQINQLYSDNYRIVWNGSLLKTIPSTLENYTKYLTEGIGKFPPELQIPAEIVVRHGIHTVVADIVARAANIEPSTARRSEQEISSEVQAMNESAPYLALSLKQLSGSEDGSGVALATLLGKQISGILYSVDGWVNDRALYSAQITDQRVLGWKSDRSLLSLGFDIDNTEDLGDYLEKQRKPIETWCTDIATPVITFYNTNGLNANARISSNGEATIRKWQLIVKAMEGYAAKSPNNSLIKLEDYISGLGHIYVQNIEDVQKVALVRNGFNKEDFFLNKIREISDEVRKGIAQHSSPRFREDYNKIYKATNDVLQYFPFGQSDNDLEPEKVKAYFTKIGNELNFARLLLSTGGVIPNEHNEFLKDVTAAKEFFKPIIYSGENNTGSYNVTFTFRTNTQKEQNASIVFGKVISQTPSGAQFEKNMFAPGEQATFQWRPGDEFKFELRWAKDGTVSPVSGGEKYVLVNDKTVSFKAGGVWSLFRFIANNQNGKRNGKVQLALHVITSAPSGATSSDSSTLLYVDVEISPKYKDEAMVFPVLSSPPTPE